MSSDLVENLEQMTAVMNTMDSIVSRVGNATDEAVRSTALLQLAQSPGGDVESTLAPLIIGSVRHELEAAVEQIEELLRDLMARLRPLLEQIGGLIERFGDQATNKLDAFSTSLDRAQTLFDQVMSQLHGGGEGAEEMLEQTFNLFDVSNTGAVTQEDLASVASLYSISALEGGKPAELVQRYDLDRSGSLDRAEVAYMVGDDTVPMLMAVVLRQYARRLAEVGGNVAGARMRSDVALHVVRYFQLVCSNNASKAEWVSDALGNGSLPEDFTGAIFAQLCLERDNPNSLTTADVGGLVVSTTYSLHPDRTLRSVDLMSNATWWEENGFDPLDRPACMEVVTWWVVEAQGGPGAPGSQSLLEDASLARVDAEVLAEMPRAARRLAERSMRAHLGAKRRAQASRRARLYHSHTSKALMRRLLGDAPASTTNPNVAQAIGSGQPAAPETLRWGQWLRNNATQSAARRQSLCFDYSGQSTTTTDSFAVQIQTVITQIRGFVEMMQEYATPAGIDRLELQVQSFAEHALDDIETVIGDQIAEIVDSAAPWIEEAAEALGSEAGQLVDQLAPALGDALVNVTGGLLASRDALGEQIGAVLDELIREAFAGASRPLPLTGSAPAPFLLAAVSGPRARQQGLSEAWTNIISTLRSLTNLVPTATRTLPRQVSLVGACRSMLGACSGMSTGACRGVRGNELYVGVCRAFIWGHVWVHMDKDWSYQGYVLTCMLCNSE